MKIVISMKIIMMQIFNCLQNVIDNQLMKIMDYHSIIVIATCNRMQIIKNSREKKTDLFVKIMKMISIMSSMFRRPYQF